MNSGLKAMIDMINKMQNQKYYYLSHGIHGFEIKEDDGLNTSTYRLSNLTDLAAHYVKPIRDFFEDENDPSNNKAVMLILKEFGFFSLNKRFLRDLLLFWEDEIKNTPEKFI